jgi:iron complex outermembrane receptor protein
VRAGYEFQAEEYQFEGAYSFPISDDLRVRIAGRYSDMTRGYVTNDAPVVFQTANNSFSGIAPFKTTPRTTDLLLRTTVVYEPTDNFDANFKITGGKVDVDGSKDNPGQPVCKPGAVNLGVVGGSPEPWDDCVLNDHVTNGVIPASQASHYQESGNGAGYDHIRVLLSSLKLNYKTEKYTITSVTGVADLKFNEFGDSTGSAYTYAVGGNAEVYQQYSEEVRLASTLQGPLNFTVGAFVQRVNRKATGSGIQNAGLGIDRGRQNSFNAYFKGNADTLSAFGQVNWKFLPEWELAVGARATQDKHNGQEGNLFLNHTLSTASSLPEGVFVGNSTDDKNISPEATLNWRPTETFMAYVAYRTASLAGGISSPSTLASTTTSDNIVFKPEDAIGYEGGIKFTALDSRLHGNVTVFRTDYKNLQVAAFNPVTFSYILRNVGKARSQGVEVTGDFRVTSDFSLRGEATYADSKYLVYNNAQCYSGQTVATGCVAAVQDLSGKPLPRAPKFVASLSANYDHSLTRDWNIGLSADVRYSSSYNYIETENPVALQRAFTTLNLAARLHNGDWDLALIGRNVTNEFYADSGVDQPRGNNSQVYAIVARPRQIVLQLTRNF